MFSQTDCQCHPRPFQISVHKEALTNAPGVSFYVSVLEDSSWCLVMVYCDEGSAPPWQSRTKLSWYILGTCGLIWCHKTADQLYPWHTTASLSLIKETKAIYTLYHFRSENNLLQGGYSSGANQAPLAACLTAEVTGQKALTTPVSGSLFMFAHLL